MKTDDVVAALRGHLDGRVLEHAPLGPYTTFRVGGPADILVEAESDGDLRLIATRLNDVPIAIVGRGSNLLVSDDGFRGVAVRLGRGFRRHEQTDDGLRLGGAVYLPAVARLCARLGLSGFEFAAEIPATFGGAVRMNAGAHDRCVADVLVSATVVDLATGERRHVSVDDLGYSYRRSNLRSGDIVSEGDVHLEPGDPKVVAEQIASYLRWRRDTQPPGRSAGSVFKNPAGDSAGRIIDSVGGKGLRVGGAEVSQVHANFIVADPDARAQDVWTLISKVQRLVLDRTGVALEPEVRFLGSFQT